MPAWVQPLVYRCRVYTVQRLLDQLQVLALCLDDILLPSLEFARYMVSFWIVSWIGEKLLISAHNTSASVTFWILPSNLFLLQPTPRVHSSVGSKWNSLEINELFIVIPCYSIIPHDLCAVTIYVHFIHINIITHTHIYSSELHLTVLYVGTTQNHSSKLSLYHLYSEVCHWQIKSATQFHQ